MKRLSDFKGDEAIDLWADLLDPIVAIFTDPEVAKISGSGGSPLIIARTMVKTHKKEVADMLLRIDPTPIDGLNIVIRLLDILLEIEDSPEIMGFLGISGQNDSPKSSTSATENTEDAKS